MTRTRLACDHADDLLLEGLGPQHLVTIDRELPASSTAGRARHQRDQRIIRRGLTRWSASAQLIGCFSAAYWARGARLALPKKPKRAILPSQPARNPGSVGKNIRGALLVRKSIAFAIEPRLRRFKPYGTRNRGIRL